MTPSELKHAVEAAGREPHYFTRETMRFFGDTMRNYGVRRTSVKTNWTSEGKWTEDGERVEVWELYRKRPVKHGLQSSTYFDCETFRKISPAQSWK